MKLPNDTIKYLKGEKFNSGLKVKISEKEKTVLYRIDYIEKIAKGKNIIHLGCTDHIPLIERKIKKNMWLHKRLVESSRRCFGIDINQEGINYIRSLGYNDVLKLDIITDDIPYEIANNNWDYMILGELLEHIDNPVSFLHSIYIKYKVVVRKFIITVPNAFSLQNLFFAFRNIECINSDHRYWFSPYTLAKVVTKAGMTVENFQFVQSTYLPLQALIKKILLLKYPVFRNTIVMIVKL